MSVINNYMSKLSIPFSIRLDCEKAEKLRTLKEQTKFPLIRLMELAIDNLTLDMVRNSIK